jgi:hypothetical protein
MRTLLAGQDLTSSNHSSNSKFKFVMYLSFHTVTIFPRFVSSRCITFILFWFLWLVVWCISLRFIVSDTPGFLSFKAYYSSLCRLFRNHSTVQWRFVSHEFQSRRERRNILVVRLYACSVGRAFPSIFTFKQSTANNCPELV